MTASKGKTSPDKGEVARAEVNGNGKPTTITWHGLKLKVPADPPGTLLRDFAALEDGRKQLAPLTRIIESILGSDQNEQVWDKVADEGWNIEQTTKALMEDNDQALIPLLMAEFGMETGESSASQGS